MATTLNHALSSFVESHLQKSQLEMGQFVFDLLEKVTFGLPKKEEIFNEEFNLEENQYNLKIYLESHIRIYQYNFHNLVPQNIYAQYITHPKAFTLTNEDIIITLLDVSNCNNIK